MIGLYMRRERVCDDVIASCACAGVAGDGEMLSKLLASNMQLFTLNTSRQPYCVQVCRAAKHILYRSVYHCLYLLRCLSVISLCL